MKWAALKEMFQIHQVILLTSDEVCLLIILKQSSPSLKTLTSVKCSTEKQLYLGYT